ncbi:uncharacterized protein PODANS_5_11114 [Podospora anserina S mat+]|uniref:Podospora anserina S mat+ genomic DNA chromosome 5, supercontig 10 n=1 Tax=Podospora anserina (strain S / ATCC MYA-4624 / DSM 980 / FGSC 10383) TaxID=515849 RepID=B2APN8_PODAN|nr:uncharacterized protein PODANS_5_11114 [Podospora anserina S mat+]CAP65910.1 unnamed protein product [Podospora anserina S mat+]CDP30227.1 Putative protein of unknown function [Podospora anserina S mat+]
MEPLSAAVTVLEVAGAITSVISAATAFMRDIRGARQEIIAVKKELTSLKGVLEILADDFHDADKIKLPHSVLERIVDVAADCQNVVNQIGGLLKEGSRVSWALSGKEEMESLREDLERHKATLSVTLDLVSVIIIKDIKDDTEHILQDTSAIKGNTAQIHTDIDRVLQGISQIQLQLNAPETGPRPSNYVLGRFLADLRTDAETILGDAEYLDDRTEQYHGYLHSQEGYDFRSPPEPTPAPITLRDTEGRRCLVPFRACRTWLEMSKAIEQLYGHLPQNDQVRAGNYEVFGPSGEIILPAFWESFVLPGWEVMLKLRQVKMANQSLKAEATIVDETKPQSEGSQKEGQLKKAGSTTRPDSGKEMLGRVLKPRTGTKDNKESDKEKDKRKEKHTEFNRIPVRGLFDQRKKEIRHASTKDKIAPPVSTKAQSPSQQAQSQPREEVTAEASELRQSYPPLQPEILQPVTAPTPTQAVFRQLQIARHSLPTPTLTPAPIISPFYYFRATPSHPASTLSAFHPQSSASHTNIPPTTTDESQPSWATRAQSPASKSATSLTTKKSSDSSVEAKANETTSRPRDKNNAGAKNVKNTAAPTRLARNNVTPPSKPAGNNVAPPGSCESKKENKKPSRLLPSGGSRHGTKTSKPNSSRVEDK